jgi:hypothetical protein
LIERVGDRATKEMADKYRADDREDAEEETPEQNLV